MSGLRQKRSGENKFLVIFGVVLIMLLIVIIVLGFMIMKPEPPTEQPPISYVDNDNDGYTTESDCNDNNPDIHPGATEVYDDKIDSDCDGRKDDGMVRTCKTICGDGFEFRVSEDSNNWIGCNAKKPSDEQCNGLDDDCDGDIDEDIATRDYDPDGVGNEGECKPGIEKCENGKWIVIGDATKPSDEVFDGKDNDCDGDIDDDISIHVICNTLYNDDQYHGNTSTPEYGWVGALDDDDDDEPDENEFDCPPGYYVSPMIARYSRGFEDKEYHGDPVKVDGDQLFCYFCTCSKCLDL